MFLSTECSTIGYKKDGNFIKPIFDEKDNSQQNEILINKIQDAAIEFIKNVRNSDLKYEFQNYSKETFFENYKNFIINPTISGISLFENIEVRDINKSKLISHKSLLYYIIHPKAFYVDFCNSSCKIVFMKSVFKIKLPYYKILKKLYINEKSN